MSYARSPREVCSTTMGTSIECPIVPPDYFSVRDRASPAFSSSFCRNPPGFALLGERQSLFLHLQRLCQVGDRILPQVIHDTRTEGDPAIVHGARHVVGAFRKTAGTLLVGRQAVQGLDDIQEADFVGLYPQGKSAGGTLARSKQTLASKLLQNLRQEMSPNILLLRDVLDHGVFAFGHLRQVHECAYCIFG